MAFKQLFMFHVLIDSSVWLDLAEKQRQTPLLEMLKHLIDVGALELIVPELVLSEFTANREKVATRLTKGLGTHFALVRQAILEAGDASPERGGVLQYLADLDHAIPLKGGAAKGTLDDIESMLIAGKPLATSDEAKIKAADRALLRKGPCHQNKNSIADALLIEIYFDAVQKGKAGERFAFVTHNKDDFSRAGGDARLPHADLAQGFGKIKSMYFISLADLLNRIDPSLRPAMKYMGYDFEPRGLTDLLAAELRLTTQVWHNRHMTLVDAVKRGAHCIVSKDVWESHQNDPGYSQTHTVEDVWKRARMARRRAERELGHGNYGPWTDFEWGKINGKLSALRWALGDDWDMLDT